MSEHITYVAVERQFLRFTRLNRALHIVMILSFLNLAVTGMTLKFSYTGWAVTVSHLLGGFEAAGLIHRVAAFFMITIFIIHLVDLARKRYKEYSSWRELIFGRDSLMFNRKDLQDFIGNLKWFLGRGPRPQFGRWT